ncbi:hypothetical protein COY07_03690 [Candidatus Peregrinibacteria bacterium CG_4_10_14_0_2_um_filter_43_11]|nr:MAG: hypothetical protein COY07_03690 [Candidatus Peregrinibacteria bacterium CG_4_10_14_0_2_um_filter_43_11]
MLKKFAFITLFFASLVLVGCARSQEVTTSELPDVIKIGWVGPLTGGLGGVGQDAKAAVEFYFTEHPMIGGKQVEVIYEDGKCNGADAAAATQKLITVDGVQAILGGACSGETLASAPIAEQNKVVMISSLSSSPEVTTAGDYIFRNYISDDQVAKTMVNYMLSRNEKIAVLSEQTDFAQGFTHAIVKHMEAAGASDKLVLNESFGVDNTDFRTLLTKVKEAGAGALVSMVQTPVSGGFMARQAKELGLDIQIYGTDTLPAPDFFDTAKDAAEGAIAVLASEDLSRGRFADFKASIEAPQSTYAISAFAYDAAEVLARAIEKVGYNGNAIKDYFYTMPTFNGVASDVKFDVNGDNNIQAAVKVARDGEFVFEK